MTVLIPKKYMKEYETDPLFNDPKRLAIIKKRIAKGEIAVIDDEDYDRLRKNRTGIEALSGGF